MAKPGNLDRDDWLRAAKLVRKLGGSMGSLNFGKLNRDDWLYPRKSHRLFHFLGPEPTFGRAIFVLGLNGLGYGVWYELNHFSFVLQFLVSFVR